jgi:hypothetical protein
MKTSSKEYAFTKSELEILEELAKTITITLPTKTNS